MKVFEKRFGMIAVGRGFITLEQLLNAMKIQIEEDVQESSHRLIGEILMEMGLLNGKQVIEVLKILDGDIEASESEKVRE